MAKYDPLRDHLASLSQDGPVTMSFADVAALVDGLPESARNHRAWWSNDSKVRSCCLAVGRLAR